MPQGEPWATATGPPIGLHRGLPRSAFDIVQEASASECSVVGSPAVSLRKGYHVKQSCGAVENCRRCCTRAKGRRPSESHDSRERP